MIRVGYTWNYKYSKDKYYIKLQEKAKAEKKLNILLSFLYNLRFNDSLTNKFIIEAVFLT